MTRTFCRTISALASLAFMAIFASSPVSAQEDGFGPIAEWFETLSQVSSTQTSRTCIAVQGLATVPVDIVLNVADSAGDVVLQRDLRIPAGEFRCTDTPYEELVAAGLEPDRTTGAVTFRIDIIRPKTVGANEAISVGSNQTRAVGAVMSMDTATGKVETYQKPSQVIARITGVTGN